MTDLDSLRHRAIAHMRAALALLDAAGEINAAGHLQMAHDVVSRTVPMPAADATPEDDPELPDLTADPALVRAIGGALAVFATLMSRGGVTPLDEIASTIGIYAVASSETSAQEGLILGCWGAMLREVAQMNDEGS